MVSALGVRSGIITVVVLAALLLAGTGSNPAPVIDALLLTGPGAVALAAIVTVALAPLAKVPKLHVTGLFALQLPWLGIVETKVRLVGKTSTNVTAPASSLPLLVIVTV